MKEKQTTSKTGAKRKGYAVAYCWCGGMPALIKGPYNRHFGVRCPKHGLWGMWEGPPGRVVQEWNRHVRQEMKNRRITR